MKKILLTSLMSFIFFSCTGINIPKRTNREPVTPKPVEKSSKNKALQQHNFVLDESGVMSISDIIKNEFNSREVIKYPSEQISKPIEIYAGNNLVIDFIDADSLEIISAPTKQDFDFSIISGTLKFKSYYQGEYVAELYKKNQKVRTIIIKNKLKYKFSEKQNYDIILDSYNQKNLDLLVKSTYLYKISFPENEKQKNALFMIIELANKKHNQTIAYENMEYLKNNFTLTEYDENKLKNLESSKETTNLSILNNDTSIPIQSINSVVTEGNISDEVKSGIDALKRDSYDEALVFFRKIPTGKIPESKLSYYLGKTYFYLNDFDQAILNLEQIPYNGENLSETYYYLGISYHKKGDIKKAKEALRKSRENDTRSTWGRKSSIYLLKL